MGNDTKIVMGRSEGVIGPLWIGGWLYTLGMLHLHMPQALFALVIWPYYLGASHGAVPPAH
jgi:hypothetical protein